MQALLSLTLVLLLGSGASLAAEALPRVLVLGDSIYREPAKGAADILQGRVELVFPAIQPGEVRNSATALEHLDGWLGDEEWDLIHFNFGLGDLVYRAPGMKSFRVLPIEAGGVRTTAPEQYDKNLRELVKRLQATGAKLMWASTTPIRHSASNVFEKGSEIEYNAIAAKVMAESEIPVNDMYHYAVDLIDMDKPASHGVDPFFFDRKPVYPPIVRSVLSELGLMRPVKGPVQVFVMAGGWSHIGGGTVIDSNKPRLGSPRGSLDHLVLNEQTASNYRHLVDKEGNWATRPDVWIQFDRRGPKSGVLGIGYGGEYKRGIGSELALGHVLGDHFDEQVCLIKSALGTPSLADELRPPSSGKTGTAYATLLKQINDSLASLADKFPDYTEKSGYQMAGLILNLGEQDQDAAMYAEYLPALIRDLRSDLKVVDLPVAIVGTGSGGREKPDYAEIIEAQQSVAALPEFEGRVRYVETRDFWPPEDARASYRHAAPERWFSNAESFYKMGKAAGEAIVGLVK